MFLLKLAVQCIWNSPHQLILMYYLCLWRPICQGHSIITMGYAGWIEQEGVVGVEGCPTLAVGQDPSRSNADQYMCSLIILSISFVHYPMQMCTFINHMCVHFTPG